MMPDPRLVLLARAGAAVASLGALVIAGWFVAAVVTPGLLIPLLPVDIAIPSERLPWLLAATALPAALFVAAMIEAILLFLGLGGGQLFSIANAVRLTRLGSLAAASALCGTLLPTVTALIASYGRPDTAPLLVFRVGSGELATLVMALLLFAFGQAMREASRLAEDNAGFI